jgi:Tfp pilus assembly protein FimV
MLDLTFANPEVLIAFLHLAVGLIGIWVCYNLLVKNSGGSWSPRLSPEQHRGFTGASDPVMLAIEEAEFYMAYGLKKEARQVIERALEKYPRDQRLLSKHHEVAS